MGRGVLGLEDLLDALHVDCFVFTFLHLRSSRSGEETTNIRLHVFLWRRMEEVKGERGERSTMPIASMQKEKRKNKEEEERIGR